MALIPFLQGHGLPYGWAWFISQSVFITVICLILMLSVAAVILADRKIWAAVQMRRGPNVVGPFGLLRTIADAVKFLLKEVIVPAGANKVIFFLAPLVSVMVAFIAWAVIPFNKGWVIADINVGILYLFAVSSVGVNGTVMAGWASNSKYAFLSALRAAAQMVSYEVSIGFVMITVLLYAGSLNISQIVHAQESALVAGFFVEYSSGPFLLFFLAEYMNVIMLCAMMSILFLGGWLSPINIWPLNIPVLGIFWFLAKTAFLFFMMAMVKAMVPRYRYDQLMRLGWKIFLPTSLLWVVLTAVWVMSPFHHHG